MVFCIGLITWLLAFWGFSCFSCGGFSISVFELLLELFYKTLMVKKLSRYIRFLGKFYFIFRWTSSLGWFSSLRRRISSRTAWTSLLLRRRRWRPWRFRGVLFTTFYWCLSRVSNWRFRLSISFRWFRLLFVFSAFFQCHLFVVLDFPGL